MPATFPGFEWALCRSPFKKQFSPSSTNATHGVLETLNPGGGDVICRNAAAKKAEMCWKYCHRTHTHTDT